MSSLAALDHERGGRYVGAVPPTIDKRVHELGDGLYAYVVTPGTWGWSNSGLIEDGGQALLVDTLFDTANTRSMLDAFAAVTPAVRSIGTVVNTHANGDHCWGNALLPQAEVVASKACAEEMLELPPARMAMLMRAARVTNALGPITRGLRSMFETLGATSVASFLDAAPFALHAFGAFDFRDVELRTPTRTFEGGLELRVGNRRVELIEVGPAHTSGDVIVHVPDARVVFTGDILFSGGHPLVWEGPVSNWITACKRVLELDAATVVPGHGPRSTRGEVAAQLDYLEYISAEARRRFDAGMDVETATRDIALDAYRAWLDPERIYVNVHTLYRDFRGDRRRPHPVAMFAGMARFARAQRLL